MIDQMMVIMDQSTDPRVQEEAVRTLAGLAAHDVDLTLVAVATHNAAARVFDTRTHMHTHMHSNMLAH